MVALSVLLGSVSEALDASDVLDALAWFALDAVLWVELFVVLVLVASIVVVSVVGSSVG